MTIAFGWVVTDRSGNRLRAPALGAVARCSRGDTAIEYLVLIGTVAIPLIPVMVAFGVWMVGLFESFRNLLLFPFP